MRANQQAPSPRARRARTLASALAAACLLGAVGSAAPAAAPAASHAAADAAGAAATVSAPLAQLAVGSAAMVQAELIAARHWGVAPCAGLVSVSWGALDPTINAVSNWANPLSVWGNAAANIQCRITFNEQQKFDWPMFCTVMVHEMGHLAGQQHSTDKASVMYPIYLAPIAECTVTASGAAATPPAATTPPAASTSSLSAPAAARAAASPRPHRRAHRHHRVRRTHH